MKLTLHKTKKNTVKLIASINKPHPALKVLAETLKEANKHSEIKYGIFNVFGAEFSPFVTVYSYISGRSEKLNKKDYYKWLDGSRSLRIKKPEWNVNEEEFFSNLEIK